MFGMTTTTVVMIIIIHVGTYRCNTSYELNTLLAHQVLTHNNILQFQVVFKYNIIYFIIFSFFVDSTLSFILHTLERVFFLCPDGIIIINNNTILSRYRSRYTNRSFLVLTPAEKENNNR